eukprot:SAG11_NODE_6557_length_1289_cov_1.422689_3_plen_158_part_01
MKIPHGAWVSAAPQAMIAMNAQMNMPQLQQIMRQFEMQSDQLEQKQEMMEDVMDSALDEVYPKLKLTRWQNNVSHRITAYVMLIERFGYCIRASMKERFRRLFPYPQGDEEEEADELVQQVFDEIGIDVGAEVSARESYLCMSYIAVFLSACICACIY